MVKVEKLLDNEEKSNIANDILRQLPEWFGIEESIAEYVNGVINTEFYVAYYSGAPIGFLSVKSNNQYTSEIYVMGILKEYHNRGIGRRLLRAAEESLIDNKVKFLMVKTLGDSHPDIHYKVTREFYYKTGFYPLEVINEIWGEENPCLIMAKRLLFIQQTI